MKILYIGSVYFSKIILEKLIQLKVELVGVISKKESNFNSDFYNIIPIAKKNKIPFFYSKDINDKKTTSWINEITPDIIYCFGWSSLLKNKILKIPKMGVVGFHPTLLPKNRGRHPLIWAKVLGLKESGTSFFFMNEGADSGPILNQKKFKISFKETAKDLYDKMIFNALIQIEELNKELELGIQKIIKQKHISNSWRKRSKIDGLIDFRMSSISICNLVRGLSKPYIGASCYNFDEEIKIWSIKIGNTTNCNIEPGKIISINKNNIEVKSGDGSVILTEHEFIRLPKKNQYLNL